MVNGKSKRSNPRFQTVNLGNIVPVSKRSQAGVIGAVLLILVVVVSAMIVMSFVVPFVKKQLEGGGCLDVVGKMEITNNLQYTCYNGTSDKMFVQIHYGDIANLTEGFNLVLESGGSSKSYEFTTALPIGVTLLGSGSNLSGNNEERTYIFSSIDAQPEIISIYPILPNGDSCEASDIITTVNVCSAPF